MVVCLPVVLKAQLYKGLINHWQRCGKQQAKAMLVQLCHLCLLVKGTTALQWKRLMCSRYLPVNNITSSETSSACSQKENKCCESKGKLPRYLFNSTLQEDLCTQYCLFAEWKSMRHIVYQKQFIKFFCAVCIDCQCPQTKKRASRDIHTGEV